MQKTIFNRSFSEIQNLTEKELKRDIGRMRDIIHKRATRHREAGTTPKKLAEILRGGEISTKGKTPDELIKEYQRAQEAIKAGTVKQEKQRKARKRKQDKKRKQRKKQGKAPKTIKAPRQKATPKKSKTQQSIEKYTIDKIQKTNDKKILQDLYTKWRTQATRRLRQFDRMGTQSPAYKMGKDLPTKRPENIDDLKRALYLLRRFLTAETGTVKKWNEAKQKIIDKMQTAGAAGINDQNFDKVMEIYDKLKSEDPSIAVLGLKYEAMDFIAGNIEQYLMYKNEPDLFELAQDFLTYRQEQAQKEIDEILKAGEGADIWDFDIFGDDEDE